MLGFVSGVLHPAQGCKILVIMFLKILQKYSHDFLFYIMNHDEVIREAIMFMFLCSSVFGCWDGNY